MSDPSESTVMYVVVQALEIILDIYDLDLIKI